MDTDLGEYLREFIAQLAPGGGVDVPDCAVGAICAQTDVDSAKFIQDVKKKYPTELAPVKAKLKIVRKTTDTGYGYMIGVDADGVVHEYKGVPVQKILNIWNYGTGDGKTPRTQFWSLAIRKLKRKYDRAADRFFNILDERFEGKTTHAKNSGKTVSSKMEAYMRNKKEYLSATELDDVDILNKPEVEL